MPELEKYIDVKFNSSPTIYTYICPESLNCSVGDELRIISNGVVENVKVVKAPYRTVIKTDKKYVLLELCPPDYSVKKHVVCKINGICISNME